MQPGGVDVARRTHQVGAVPLLGRHVGRRAHERVAHGQRAPGPGGRREHPAGAIAVGVAGGTVMVPRPGRPDQPEVGDPHPAVVPHQDVARLEVPVDDPAVLAAGLVLPREGVGVLHPGGELDREVEAHREGRVAVRSQPLVEGAAVHVLDEQPRHAAELVDEVRGADVGVQAEGDPGLRLAHEARPSLFAGELVGQRRLDRQHATQLAVVDEEHLAHAAAGAAPHLPAPGDDLPRREGEAPGGRRVPGRRRRRGGLHEGRQQRLGAAAGGPATTGIRASSAANRRASASSGASSTARRAATPASTTLPSRHRNVACQNHPPGSSGSCWHRCAASSRPRSQLALA